MTRQEFVRYKQTEKYQQDLEKCHEDAGNRAFDSFAKLDGDKSEAITIACNEIVEKIVGNEYDLLGSLASSVELGVDEVVNKIQIATEGLEQQAEYQKAGLDYFTYRFFDRENAICPSTAVAVENTEVALKCIQENPTLTTEAKDYIRENHEGLYPSVYIFAAVMCLALAGYEQGFDWY